MKKNHDSEIANEKGTSEKAAKVSKVSLRKETVTKIGVRSNVKAGCFFSGGHINQ